VFRCLYDILYLIQILEIDTSKILYLIQFLIEIDIANILAENITQIFIVEK